MRNAKLMLCATVFMALLAGAMFTDSVPTTAAADQKAPVGDHWRHHDGHWSYWHDGDQRWYYTDGSHWFYNDGSAWKVYGFDKQFGRDRFERGEYKGPGEGAKIEAPRHGYYRAPGK